MREMIAVCCIIVVLVAAMGVYGWLRLPASMGPDEYRPGEIQHVDGTGRVTGTERYRP